MAFLNAAEAPESGYGKEGNGDICFVISEKNYLTYEVICPILVQRYWGHACSVFPVGIGG